MIHTDHSNFGPLTGKSFIPYTAAFLPAQFFGHFKPSKEDGAAPIHTQTMFEIRATDLITQAKENQNYNFVLVRNIKVHWAGFLIFSLRRRDCVFCH